MYATLLSVNFKRKAVLKFLTPVELLH